jgi:hypothetical protein
MDALRCELPRRCLGYVLCSPRSSFWGTCCTVRARPHRRTSGNRLRGRRLQTRQMRQTDSEPSRRRIWQGPRGGAADQAARGHKPCSLAFYVRK